MSASCFLSYGRALPLKFNQVLFEMLNVIIIPKISKGKLESRDSVYEASGILYFVTQIYMHTW